MKLTNYIVDLGRVVAYYPNLKKVTCSTTATVLLCQLLYWTPKAKEYRGWIYKNSEEIEEETGLSYNEQKTARAILTELGLTQEEYKRLEHKIGFKVNQEVLNRRWEESQGKQVEETPVEVVPVIAPVIPEPGSIEEYFMKPVPKTEIQSKPVVKKKGDLVDLAIDTMNSPGMKKMNECITIRNKIEKRLDVNTDNKKWEHFIEFVYGKQTRDGEKIDVFLDYAIREGFNAIYWTPEKMKTLWPQAFIGMNSNEQQEDFVEKLPERKEEVYAPMPQEIGKKRELF
jgi:hypothetical protein